MRIRVYHADYGCDTGCCGHVVEVDGDTLGSFDFGHPRNNSPEERMIFARQVAEHAIAETSVECLKTIDWNTVEIDADEVIDD